MKTSAIIAAIAVATLAASLAPSAHAAFPGANGQIVFSANIAPDSTSLYTINPDGTGLTGLTVGGENEVSPAWSADGTRILYERFSGTIRRVDFDGRGNVPVGAGADPYPSPDGTKIVFQGPCCLDPVRVMNADGTGVQSIGTGFDPTWSPDGLKIALARNASGRTDVWTMSPSGSGLTNLTSDIISGSREPNWSPDGSKLVFTLGSSGIWTMNADGTAKAMVKPSGFEPAWSPDGTKIVYRDSGGLRTIDPDGTNDAVLFSGSAFAPDWQPCTGPCPVSTAVPHDAPAAANRAYIPFVPNYRQTVSDTQCAARGGAASQHGPPLAFSACNPPALPPGTVAHQGPDGESGVIYRRGDGFGGGGSSSDTLFIEGGGTDIRTGTAGGSDYNPGGSQDATLVTKVRVTDSYSGSGRNESATTVDFDLSFRISCAPDPDPAFGSTCAGFTEAQALLGGSEALRPYRKTVIQLFEVRMKDVGVNGVIGDADDQSFVIQGISIP